MPLGREDYQLINDYFGQNFFQEFEVYFSYRNTGAGIRVWEKAQLERENHISNKVIK